MIQRTSLGKRIGFGASLAAALFVIAVFSTTYYVAGPPETPIEIAVLPAAFAQKEKPVLSDKVSMKAITLNLGHGRKLGPNQIFQSSASITANLEDVAEMLRRERPDVVALQEADGPSVWSGEFDHVRYLAETAEFPYSIRGEHVNGMGLYYGTALLSALPLEDAFSLTFAPSPPTFPKGFVACTMDWPCSPGLKIDVVSVHLDFSRKSVRLKQAAEIIRRFAPRERPMILMGDFNCQWKDKRSSIRLLAGKLDLHVFRHEAEGLHTFTRLKKRLDWILVSPELEFQSYRVLPDVLSDHFAVACELRRAE